jgi:hypothetical protein
VAASLSEKPEGWWAWLRSTVTPVTFPNGLATCEHTRFSRRMKRRFDFVVSESEKWGNRNAHGLRFVSVKYGKNGKDYGES